MSSVNSFQAGLFRKKGIYLCFSLNKSVQVYGTIEFLPLPPSGQRILSWSVWYVCSCTRLSSEFNAQYTVYRYKIHVYTVKCRYNAAFGVQEIDRVIAVTAL